MNHNLVNNTSIILYKMFGDILWNQTLLNNDLFQLYFLFRDDIKKYYEELYYEDVKDEYYLGTIVAVTTYGGYIYVTFENDKQQIALVDLKEEFFYERK